MPFFAFFTACLAAALFHGAWLYRRSAGRALANRWAVAILPPSLLCLAALLTHKFITCIYYNLNWIRLQKTYVMAYGYPLFHGPESGPAIGTMYPPVSVMAYLPATFFPFPLPAMRAAEVITMSFFFLPVLWMFLGERPRDRRVALYLFMAFLCFAFLPFTVSSIRMAAFNIHADAIALGFGALACAALSTAKDKENFISLSLSAVFAVLAVWSKQVAAPMILALALYVYLAYGARSFRRYLICLFAAGAVISGILIAVHGWHELVFQLLTIPSRQHFRGKEGMTPFGYATYKIVRESGLMLAIGLLAVRPLYALRGSVSNFSGWLRENPWMMTLLVAIFLAPVSLLGRAKAGGSSNTLCFTTYFLAISAPWSLASAVRTAVREKSNRAEHLSQWALIGLLMAFTLGHTLSVYLKFMNPDYKKPNFAVVAYDYLKKYPGETYFPRLTLMHLIVEKKLYHDSMPLVDREWSGFPLSDAHLRAHLPEKFHQVAFLIDKEGNINCLRLPEFTERAYDERLPGFFVYRRKEGGIN